MAIDRQLDNIFDTGAKVKILRFLTSKSEGFMATGREIARLTGLTPPAAHSALKELYNHNILKREILGRQHIYSLNYSNRTVSDIIKPAFSKELSFAEDIKEFLVRAVKNNKIGQHIVSILLYGSMVTRKTDDTSDCDIAVIVKNRLSAKEVEDVFIERISGEFSRYFGIHLDPYIKPAEEFKDLLKKGKPPVSTLIKAYEVVWGKDPLEAR